MFHRNVLLGGAVLWLTACGGQATLQTDQTTYAPGADVSLQLQNESLQSLGYNLCYSALQRHEGETWTAVPRTDTEFCQASQFRLKPGESSALTRHLADTLEEGEYRYLTSVEWGGKNEDVVSNSFNVARASTP